MATSLRASERVQVLLDAETRRTFEDSARREGLSLSAWLREAGLERAARLQQRQPIRTVTELEQFFQACAERESGTEPEWEEHRRVIEGSIRRGRADS